jgi:uncharacterized cupredoxin-like copper-binding protein
MKRRAVAALALAAVLVGTSAVSAVGRPSQSTSTVRVTMSGNQNAGFRFAGVPRSINDGRVTFRFRNTSAAPIQHNFTVVRTFGRARAFRSGNVAPGATRTLTVGNLRPGIYVAVCTVFNGQHALNGMISTFQVQ